MYLLLTVLRMLIFQQSPCDFSGVYISGVDSPLELVPNSLVEVPEKWGWIPARITDEPYMDRAWVSMNGSKKEVEISTLRFLVSWDRGPGWAMHR